MPYTLKLRCRSLYDKFTNLDLLANLGGLVLMLTSRATGHNPQRHQEALIAVTVFSLVKDLYLIMIHKPNPTLDNRRRQFKMFLTYCKAAASVPAIIYCVAPQKADGVTASLFATGAVRSVLGMLKSTAPALDITPANEEKDGSAHGYSEL